MLGLPKGSLEESTKSLFAKAGWKITTSSRSYKPSIDDAELDGRFVRAQEVSRYVEHGFFDCGLTGYDWIQENASDVVEVCDLIYSRASMQKSRWVLCVPESSAITRPEQLAGKRVATELVGTVRRYFAARNIPAEIEFSWGATEVKVPDLVDAIVDITETGNSIRANKLRIIDTLLENNTKLIANKQSWANPAKRKKIETIATKVYGAKGVHFENAAEENIKLYKKMGLSGLPVCMAKTHLSLSHDPELKGAPKGFTLTVREIRPSAGAGFLYALCGKILTMPSLPSRPVGEHIDIDSKGRLKYV